MSAARDKTVKLSFDNFCFVCEESCIRYILGVLIIRFAILQVKCIMQQLFRGLRYLHENFIVHR